MRVGKGGEHCPFMSAHLPEPVAATHFGFTTGYGATGGFRFHREYALGRIALIAECKESSLGIFISTNIKVWVDKSTGICSGSN